MIFGQNNIVKQQMTASTNISIKNSFVVIFAMNLVLLSFCSIAQTKSTTDSVQPLNLDQCIVYALKNQPNVLRSDLDIDIAKKNNEIKLSAWLPQANLNANYVHYNQLPTTLITNSANPNGPLLKQNTGIANTFIPQLTITETIFSPDVAYAASSARLLVQQAQLSNDSTKINLVANVSKSFYNVLFTLEQITILKEDTLRLARNVGDAYHQYIGGIVDKTDYKEAFISLNNSKAALRQAKENVVPQYATLKQLIGFPPEKNFSISFDTLQMIRDIAFDTTQVLKFENRIEFKQIETAKALQKKNVEYNKSKFLPTLSAFYNYNYEYENPSSSRLFSQAYPYSYCGATLSLPLFTGMQRLGNIQKAKLQQQQLNLSETGLQLSIYSQYTAALAQYKSNLYNLNILNDNVAMAKEVYNVVTLQYKQGVIPYLNVITAESNVMSSEINYYNALFQVLSSKVDLEKAMGNTLTKK